MKKVMYYFLLLSSLLLTSLAFTSCNPSDNTDDLTDIPDDSTDDPNDDDSDGDDDSDNNPDTNTANTVKYGGKEFKLTHGFEEQFNFKAQDNDLGPKDNHSGGQINIADGEFFSTTVYVSGRANLIWRPRKASVWLYTKMYSPGAGGLSDGTYEFMPNKTEERDPSLANKYMFSEGKFAVDLNNDGEVESSDGEFLKITDGTIELMVSGDDYTVKFDLSLENDMKAVGSFTDDFIQVEAQ